MVNLNKVDMASIILFQQRRQFIVALGVILITLVLIATGLLSGFLKITPAYAKGTTEIVNPTGDPQIVFTSTSTSDPGRQADFGLDQHVGRCTVNLHKGLVNFTILNGYPGYQCTLSISLSNKGKSAAVLQDVEVETVPALQVYAINISTGAVLQPGEEVTGDFMLQIMPQAKENMGYPVSIHMVFMAAPGIQANP
jgi:hypothetical protein